MSIDKQPKRSIIRFQYIIGLKKGGCSPADAIGRFTRRKIRIGVTIRYMIGDITRETTTEGRSLVIKRLI